jgi:hypothetical protein
MTPESSKVFDVLSSLVMDTRYSPLLLFVIDVRKSKACMGGHAAWRKRVAEGGLAKGSGGAALRHRPRLGRKGADIEKYNRLGNLGGHGNPKKRNRRANRQRSVGNDRDDDDTELQGFEKWAAECTHNLERHSLLWGITVSLLVLLFIGIYLACIAGKV